MDKDHQEAAAGAAAAAAAIVQPSEGHEWAAAAAAAGAGGRLEGLNGPVDATVRRSGRDRHQRIVIVGGHPVLLSNMYEIGKGEPSVFDRELNKNKGKDAAGRPVPAGAQAVVSYGQFLGKRPSTAPPGSPKAKRKVAPLEAKRTAYNGEMTKEKEVRELRCAQFFMSNMKAVEHFIRPEIKAKLKALSDRARQASLPPPPPELSEQPAQIKAEMRDYQLDGLAWMASKYDHGVNTILGDEMGLGKTLQAIAFLSHLKHTRGARGPSLVVVPLSTLPNWMAEIKMWCPSMRALKIHGGSKEERQRMMREDLGDVDAFDIVVTTYEMVCTPDIGRFLSQTYVWRSLILDEGHKLKNDATNTSQALRGVRRLHTLLLTGTPLQNNLRELWALLNFMYPEVFTTPGPFEDAFDLSRNKVDDAALDRAHHLLRPLVLRRVKADVALKLPPKVETRIACPLSDMQLFWYRRLLLRDSALFTNLEQKGAAAEADAAGDSGAMTPREGLGGGGGAAAAAAGKAGGGDQEGVGPSEDNQVSAPSNAWRRLSFLLQQLLKCANHPFLFPGAHPMDRHPPAEPTLDEVVNASGKMQMLDRLLPKLKERGHRVVLFSHFTMMLDLLEDYMALRGYEYTRIDGGTNRVQRMINIAQFNKPDSKVFVFLLSTRAGGLGINLQTADTCILYDSDWNPQVDNQVCGYTKDSRLASPLPASWTNKNLCNISQHAIARVHRIGQKKPVHVYRFCCEGTAEERLQQRAEKKMYLDVMVNRNSTHQAEAMERLGVQEMLGMLSFGADRIFGSGTGKLPSEKEVERIIDRAAIKAEAEAGSSEDADSFDADDKENDGGEGEGVQTAKLSAASFDKTQTFLSTFNLMGTDYSAYRQAGNRDIASEWAAQAQAEGKRKRVSATVQIDGFTVKKSNLYTMETGELSVFNREANPAARAAAMVPAKRKKRKAGHDYGNSDYCQNCWDGGHLYCCEGCPVSMHAECAGMTTKEFDRVKGWRCPHHSCAVCGRVAADVGGLLFRCEVCPQAYCEDHLPEEVEIVGANQRFEALGFDTPSQACYVVCGPECCDHMHKLGDRLMRPYDHPDGPMPGETWNPPEEPPEDPKAAKRREAEEKRRIEAEALFAEAQAREERKHKRRAEVAAAGAKGDGGAKRGPGRPPKDVAGKGNLLGWVTRDPKSPGPMSPNAAAGAARSTRRTATEPLSPGLPPNLK